MGSILKASCKKCGFEKTDIFYGGGIMNFMKICNVPAYNSKTKRFSVKNIFKEHGEHIIFYNDNRMFKGKLGRNPHQWGDIFLKQRNNFCPSCKEYTLTFKATACFD